MINHKGNSAMNGQTEGGQEDYQYGASLRAFVAQGFDRDAAEVLMTQLVAELRPKNLIERMWLRDIAMLSVRAAELRLVQIAVHKHLMRSSGAEASPDAPRLVTIENDTPRHSAVPAIAIASEGLAPGAREEVQLEQAVAQSYAEHLAMIERLVQMETGVRADRDRVILQFDRRRSDELVARISLMRAQTGD
jgi:hypothetical protein